MCKTSVIALAILTVLTTGMTTGVAAAASPNLNLENGFIMIWSLLSISGAA